MKKLSLVVALLVVFAGVLSTPAHANITVSLSANTCSEIGGGAFTFYDEWALELSDPLWVDHMLEGPVSGVLRQTGWQCIGGPDATIAKDWWQTIGNPLSCVSEIDVTPHLILSGTNPEIDYSSDYVKQPNDCIE